MPGDNPQRDELRVKTNSEILAEANAAIEAGAIPDGIDGAFARQIAALRSNGFDVVVTREHWDDAPRAGVSS